MASTPLQCPFNNNMLTQQGSCSDKKACMHQQTLCDIMNLLAPFLLTLIQQVSYLSVSDLKMKAN